MMMNCPVVLLLLLLSAFACAADQSHLRDIDAIGTFNLKLVAKSVQRRLQVSAKPFRRP